MLIPINEYELGRLIINEFYGALPNEDLSSDARETLDSIQRNAIIAIYILEFGAFLILWLSIFFFLNRNIPNNTESY
jgi:hypothetical protein